MYLTRTKLLAAVVLLGALTTGVGTHFRTAADAQDTPKAKTPEAAGKVNLGEDKGLHFYTRVSEPKERWEYKFIPMSQAPKLDDFQVELKKQDRDGWEYCGTQDLLAGNKATASPYLVFKRPSTAVSAERVVELDMLKKVLAEQEYTAAQGRVKSRVDAATAQYRQAEAAAAAAAAAIEKRRAELRAKGNESVAEIEKVRLALRLQQTKALEQSAKVLESDLKKNAEKADRAKTDEAKAKANGLTALKEGMEAAKKRSVEIDKAIQEGEEQVKVYQKEGNHPALARAMQRLTILQELSARAEKELLELQFGFTNAKPPTGR